MKKQQQQMNKKFQKTQINKTTQQNHHQFTYIIPSNPSFTQPLKFYTGHKVSFNTNLNQTLNHFTPSLGSQTSPHPHIQPLNQHRKRSITNNIHHFNPNLKYLPQQIKQTTSNQPSQNIPNQYSNENSLKPSKPSVFTSNIDIDTIVRSMNTSSLRQMSKAQNVNHQDLIKLINDTLDQNNLYSMLPDPKTQSLKHYFRIVQINQSHLFDHPKSFSVPNLCEASSLIRIKYQILIGLDGKQIKFQSMLNRNLHYNINLDTVKCQFIESEQITQFQHRVKFACGNKAIQIFINQSSLPFHLNSDRSKVAVQYIERSAKQISKFLLKAIGKSRGAQFKLYSLIDKDSQFFMKNYATEQQFAQYCQTGDILLFKDNHTFAKIQRALTNSQYDHIAFVFRHEKYGICLIESGSALGVSLTVWTHLIRRHWFRGIESISWRRLLIHNKPKDYQKRVQQFITDNKNKKYGISFQKLLTFSRRQELSRQQNRDRTYFCSQLVAELYKVLGLLDPKVSSSQYWPKHFSEKGYMSMLGNSALDRERVLVFEEEILKENYRGYQSK